MIKATDVSVVIGAHAPGIGQTLRMALRGAGVRAVSLAATPDQLLAMFAASAPDVLLIYFDQAVDDDPGMQLMRFARRSEQCPHRQIPIVAVSQGRDLTTIQAVASAGAHEYALFPASGEQLLKKVHAARTSTRPFIETPDYVGPERRTAPR